RLGRYELLVPIAKGGMARVWAARQHGQRGFTKLVAIKTILPHLVREAEFESMFLDEARIASLVHHPNVCEIYELGDDAGVLFLAMEWVSGDSLMHVMRGRGRVEAIDLRLAARIVADGAAGLHAAHELKDDDDKPMGVVHRDVSPHNILVTHDGHVKVADFGVAKALGQMHSATVAGQIKGKLAYMAPEQITSTKFDRRADIFALGCILYEATTGLQPFLGDSDPQVMHALMKGDYVEPSKLMVGYPHELENIIFKALKTDPNERFATAEEMKVELEQWLAVSGPIVTTSHVAQLVRERIGAVIDKRRDKIKDASQQQTNDSGSLTPGGATPPPGSTSGVREHSHLPHRQPSNPSFLDALAGERLGSNVSGSYPGQTSSASSPGTQPSRPGGGSSGGHASMFPPGPDASASGPVSMRDQSVVQMPPTIPGHATHYGKSFAPPQFNPFQPLATSRPGTMMRNLVIVGLAIILALVVALVVVLLMGLTKRSPAPVVLPKIASVTTTTNAQTAEPAPQERVAVEQPAAADRASTPLATTTPAAKPADKPEAETKLAPPPAHHETTSHRPTPLPGTPEAVIAN
ncbi:MAG: protein kinase, partial [Polyangiaceae bacterium]